MRGAGGRQVLQTRIAREATVLFIDIKGFTAGCAQMTVAQVPPPAALPPLPSPPPPTARPSRAGQQTADRRTMPGSRAHDRSTPDCRSLPAQAVADAKAFRPSSVRGPSIAPALLQPGCLHER